MHLFGKNLGHEVALIAEIGVNHEGSFDKACALLDLAAEAGADAVKFQSYTPERFCAADDAARLERVTRFMLDKDQHRALAARAADRGIHFFSTAVTEDWVPLLAELGEAIKIASGDLSFQPVIEAAARSGRKVILSTGAGTIAEIERGAGWFAAAAGEGPPVSDRLALLHCVAAYPVPIEQANLLSIPFLQQRFPELVIGYSNHVLGREAPLAAVALGARIVEVHFTDKKEGREFRDHALSADPDDLAYLARALPAVAAARGAFGKQPMPCEEAMIPIIRKGVVAARDLAAGTVLTRDDLMYARPATGYPSDAVDTLIGAALREGCIRGSTITPAMLGKA